MQLKSKIFISGEILLHSGLHIGGAKSSLEIGGLDNPVIKSVNGVPYIPGSSLKGKLRSMLAKLDGTMNVDDDSEEVRSIFGCAKKGSEKVTRLIVRDATLDTTAFKQNKDFEDVEFETTYGEVKWENVIDRKRGTAKDPRQIERVPVGSIFKFEMVFDDYDDKQTDTFLTKIRLAMRLLEGDYIGGSGTRGYGKIKFETVTFKQKNVEAFEQGNVAIDYSINGQKFTY
jgi:CRISPR-associated protein Csm3